MKIIHCADLHLDSVMETHMTREQAVKRNQELLNSFVRLTEYAAKEGVRLVLIAGDFFDGTRVPRRTVETVLDAMRQTPDIDYLYLKGNHDLADSVFADFWLPENLKQFSDDWTTYTYEEVSVSGIEMTQENAQKLYESLPSVKSRVHIVMLHGQTGTVSGIDRVNLNLLKNRGITYLALGHIHSCNVGKLDENGIYCYPGCLEGRGFDECGEKGFVLLDTGARRIRPEFHPFAGRRLYRIAVDITGLETNRSVSRAMKDAAQGIRPEDMVEFVLTGRCAPEALISVPYLHSRAEQDFFFVKIKDETRLAIDAQDYAKDISLKGEFIRLVLSGPESEKEKAAIIRTGLEALAGETITV